MTIRFDPSENRPRLSSRRPRRLPLLLVGLFYSPRAADGDFGATQNLTGFVSRAGHGLFAVVGCQRCRPLQASTALDVELVHVGSSPIAMAAYLAGEIDILGGGGSAGPNAYLRGQRDLVFFGAMNSKFVFSVYAHPSIANMAGVRGKRVGVTRFGGTMDFATRHFLRQNGFDPGREVTMVQVGRVQDILSGLIAGSVDVGTMAFPYDIKAKESGFRELADLSQSGARYASSSFLARRQFLAQNKGHAEGFVRAIIEAMHFIRTRAMTASRFSRGIPGCRT